MDNLETIGEQESKEITSLQQTKDMLLAEIRQGEELLSESRVIKGQAESLRKELKTLKEEQKETVKKIKVSKKDLSDLENIKLETKQLMDNSITELETKREELQLKIDNQIKGLQENEERFNTNSIELAKKLSNEKKEKELSVKAELSIVCDELEEVELKLKSASARCTVIEKENKELDSKNKKLGLEIKNKEASIKVLASNTSEYAVFDEDLVKVNLAVGEANKKLDGVTKKASKEKEKLDIVKKDQEVMSGWLREREEKIKALASKLAKKTNDSSILRMLNEL